VFGEGVLYCTPVLGKKGPPRYSAISFEGDAGDVRCGVLVAAVKVKVIGGNLESSKVLLHVAEMELSTERQIQSYWKFKRYKFKSQITCIDQSKMVDHIFLYPDSLPNVRSSLTTTTLGLRERYWLIPRTLFERKGTLDVPDICELSTAATVQSARAFLLSNQAKGVITPTVVKQFDVYSTNDGTHTQALT
jgi:hypothetical protein